MAGEAKLPQVSPFGRVRAASIGALFPRSLRKCQWQTSGTRLQGSRFPTPTETRGGRRRSRPGSPKLRSFRFASTVFPLAAWRVVHGSSRGRASGRILFGPGRRGSQTTAASLDGRQPDVGFRHIDVEIHQPIISGKGRRPYAMRGDREDFACLVGLAVTQNPKSGPRESGETG